MVLTELNEAVREKQHLESQMWNIKDTQDSDEEGHNAVLGDKTALNLAWPT